MFPRNAAMDRKLLKAERSLVSTVHVETAYRNSSDFIFESEVPQGGPGLFFKTLYYKVRQFTTKCDRQLLQVVTALLLKVAKWFVINCDR